MSSDVELQLTDVAPQVVRITAPNPGPKTLDGTNLYMVGSREAILIDAGPADSAFLDALAAFLRGRIRAILLTHDHPDHAGGSAYLSKSLSVPVWLSRLSSNAVRSALPSPRIYSAEEAIEAAGGSLRVVETPGHAWDHVCFLLQPHNLLFSGDTILGQGTTLVALPEGDMRAYMETLAKLKALNASAIAPGHGPIIGSPTAKIDEYITHRTQREKEVLDALHTVDTAEGIVDLVYRPASPAIRSLAVLSVGAQLKKLLDEERIEPVGGGYRILADS